MNDSKIDYNKKENSINNKNESITKGNNSIDQNKHFLILYFRYISRLPRYFSKIYVIQKFKNINFILRSKFFIRTKLNIIKNINKISIISKIQKVKKISKITKLNKISFHLDKAKYLKYFLKTNKALKYSKIFRKLSQSPPIRFVSRFTDSFLILYPKLEKPLIILSYGLILYDGLEKLYRAKSKSLQYKFLMVIDFSFGIYLSTFFLPHYIIGKPIEIYIHFAKKNLTNQNLIKSSCLVFSIILIYLTEKPLDYSTKFIIDKFYRKMIDYRDF